MTKSWRSDDIGDLRGQVAIVTGGNRGLGFVSGRELARHGASVVLACRDPALGEAAAARLRSDLPGVDVVAMSIDLAADRAAFVGFAEEFAARHGRLDILLNNAALVSVEHHQRAANGVELQMAVNHLGHFSLCGALFDSLRSTPGARVVSVTSGGYKMGEIDFGDLGWTTREYKRTKAYGDSKLANVWFMAEFDRRLADAGVDVVSVAAHPGLTGTERQQSEGMGGRLSHWLATPMEKGVRSQLFAATSASVSGGELYGPRIALWGSPTRQKIKPPIDWDDARRLWSTSEELTGFSFP